MYRISHNYNSIYYSSNCLRSRNILHIAKVWTYRNRLRKLNFNFIIFRFDGFIVLWNKRLSMSMKKTKYLDDFIRQKKMAENTLELICNIERSKSVKRTTNLYSLSRASICSLSRYFSIIKCVYVRIHYFIYLFESSNFSRFLFNCSKNVVQTYTSTGGRSKKGP